MSIVTVFVMVAVFAVAIGSGVGERSSARPLVSTKTATRSARGHPLSAGWATARLAAACLAVVCLALAAYVVTLVFAALLVLVLSGIAVATALARRRNRLRSGDGAIVDRLAEVIDLYAVALFSGHNVATATDQVASWAPAEVGVWLRWCVEQSRHGRALSDALEELPERLGAPVRPLVAALVANDRHGAPITTSLALLAADVRNERRRRAETAARRLPVLLLFPLVVCVLPAFLLLTVIPVVIDTFVAFEL